MQDFLHEFGALCCQACKLVKRKAAVPLTSAEVKTLILTHLGTVKAKWLIVWTAGSPHPLEA